MTSAMLCLLLAQAAAAAPVARASAAAEEDAAPDPGAPVRFRNEELFRVRAPSGKLNPAQRAAAIESRLLGVAGGPSEAITQVHTLERGQSTDVLVGDVLLVAVTDEDAAGRPREQVALEISGKIRAVLQREFDGRSLRGLIAAGVYSALATLLFILALLALRVGSPRLRVRLANWRPRWIPNLRLGSVDLLSPDRVAAALASLTRLLAFAAALFALGVYLNTVLSFFPWTRGFAEGMAAYVLHAFANVFFAVAGYLPNLVYLALIYLVVRWILKIIKLLADELQKGSLVFAGFHADWAGPTYKIVRFLVLALSAVVAFPYLPGSQSPAFQGVSIFVGVLFSLGSSSAISNVV
ncbi:MAG TPA: hypothetical protein VH083_23510, partial [Myxococcales bacterium]|nr:hypothetical protein [Myxococcales bacterium]